MAVDRRSNVELHRGLPDRRRPLPRVLSVRARSYPDLDHELEAAAGEVRRPLLRRPRPLHGASQGNRLQSQLHLDGYGQGMLL